MLTTSRWFWPIVVVIAVWFAPESPWWLVRQHRLEEAKNSLRRLVSKQDSDDIDQKVTLMAVTTEHERELNASTSLIACFKGTDLRRTVIVIGVYCMQVASGTTLRAYATYFFQQAGLPTDQSFNMSIVTYVLSFLGTVVSVRVLSSIYYLLVVPLLISGLTVVPNASHWTTNILPLGPQHPHHYLPSHRRPRYTPRHKQPVLGNCVSPRHHRLCRLHLHDPYNIRHGIRDTVLPFTKQIRCHRTFRIRGGQCCC